ncbi:hypothetical protein GCM10010306_060920 [Streptomyces umbrinus]|nr:hypothetical protein GCM10010306_060920 [Streptomyces umbrinus]
MTRRPKSPEAPLMTIRPMVCLLFLMLEKSAGHIGALTESALEREGLRAQGPWTRCQPWDATRPWDAVAERCGRPAVARTAPGKAREAYGC